MKNVFNVSVQAVNRGLVHSSYQYPAPLFKWSFAGQRVSLLSPMGGRPWTSFDGCVLRRDAPLKALDQWSKGIFSANVQTIRLCISTFMHKRAPSLVEASFSLSHHLSTTFKDKDQQSFFARKIDFVRVCWRGANFWWIWRNNWRISPNSVFFCTAAWLSGSRQAKHGFPGGFVPLSGVISG